MSPPASTTERPARRARPSVPWWRRPWIVPLALSTLVFLTLSVPPYLGLDPDQAPIPVRADVPWHYPMLWTHIAGGTVLMVLVIGQVWPWLRERHPSVHRWCGRVYVFGGVPLVGIPALLIAPLSHTGPSSQVGTTLWAVAWLGFTVTGYVMVRRRRYAEHREWMLRSFVLIYGIALQRLVVPLLLLAMLPRIGRDYDGGVSDLVMDLFPASMFVSWMVPLIVLEWWLGHTRRIGRRPSSAVS
ncbi:hypothetical protein BJF83_16980 [Nocardiopsis sp. CNR-923]|uniref:DUF2306 domain-containing protein n=1 Tax=Nocardiopsis sp. CNR-923 TaxID=1904965 RepID=UPI00095B4483|nr:DUF2306 domain-containing protein [Nocardiopsis sp. CNR-923]OLT27878.1 hypothetical protein BJF83_16980 [Nocardiopsis sp. CNR-923]